MTRSLSNTDGLDEADKRFLEQIKTVGWNVTNVLKRAGEVGPGWSFSCGIYFKFRHPEIAIFGLDSETRTQVINNVGLAIQNGKTFGIAEQYGDIFERSLCTFRKVHESQYAEYLGWALWFYEGCEFPVLQFFWPDKNGRYPWNEDCNSAVRQEQPLLFMEREATDNVG